MGPNDDGSAGGNILDQYRWWLDPDNDNSVYQIIMTNDDLVDVIGLDFGDPVNQYCVYTKAREWCDFSCTWTHGDTRAMCEIMGKSIVEKDLFQIKFIGTAS